MNIHQLQYSNDTDFKKYQSILALPYQRTPRSQNEWLTDVNIKHELQLTSASITMWLHQIFTKKGLDVVSGGI